MNRLSDKQRQIIAHSNLHKPIITVCHGPVRSGKTFVLLFLFFAFVAKFRGQGVNFIILGYSAASVERNVLEPLKSLFGLDTSLDQKNRFHLFGNSVYCFGADDSQAFKAIQGMTAHGALINEWTLCHPASTKELFARCSGAGARIFADTNPDNPLHYVKTDYIDHSGETLSTGQEYLRAWQFEIEDNHTLTREYIETLKLSIGPGVFYDRKIKGLWVAAEGAIYPSFNLSVHVCEPFEIPEHWTKIRGIDLGYNNPFVCLWGAISPDNVLYIYDEHYKPGMLIKDHIEIINQRKGRFLWTVCDHDAQEVAEMRAPGLNFYTIPAKKDVSLGIQKVGSRLVVQPNGKPRLMIFNQCKNTIRETAGYMWDKSKDSGQKKEEPLKVNDHTCDALRYMVMQIEFGGSQYF